jgi:lipopolysaccharide biosynthesis glycosyltransferase
MAEVKDRNDTMHIVCAADSNYGAYAGITLSSVLTANDGEQIHVHLFSDGVNARDITRMARMARQAGAQFSTYDIKQRLEGLSRPSTPYYTRTTYSRLFFADLLPLEMSRVIYLDCDIICVGNLRELWRFGETVAMLAAVRDVWVDKCQEHKVSLGMPTESTYYNSGVLLINVEAWRRNEVGKRLFACYRHRGTSKYGDQDIINAVLWRETVELPRRWNVGVTSPIADDASAQVKAAANIHFWGGIKPWHFGYRVWVRTGAGSYRKAKAASLWRWKLPDFHLGRLRWKMSQALTGWDATVGISTVSGLKMKRTCPSRWWTH